MTDPSVDRAPTDSAIIAGYAPIFLRDLLAGIATDWLAKFRSTQILFARFSGFIFRGTDDMPALAALANDPGQAIDNKGGV